MAGPDSAAPPSTGITGWCYHGLGRLLSGRFPNFPCRTDGKAVYSSAGRAIALISLWWAGYVSRGALCGARLWIYRSGCALPLRR